MYSLKLAHLVRDYVDAEVIEFYRDMRTFGKGYEAFYERVEAAGRELRPLRQGYPGRAARRAAWPCSSTDVYSGKPIETLVDMVVLSTGLEPQAISTRWRHRSESACSPDGFFLERHPKLAPVETTTDGVFLAGACQGPKDIPDSVAQGGAAAAAALSLMDAGRWSARALHQLMSSREVRRLSHLRGPVPVRRHLHGGDRERRARWPQVNEVLCKGCGACVAACPAGAAIQNGFTNEQVLARSTVF